MSDTRAQRLIAIAQEEVGGAYVFAALGEKCTPANREKYALRKPAHATAIRTGCQVLRGKRVTCDGCRYNSKRIFDCRGFTSYVLKQVTGRSLKGGGATSQWNDNTNWVEKGPLSTLPNKPCILFNRSKMKNNTMAHTGLYLGESVVAQAGGYGGTGVHVGPLRKNYWTDWAIPVSLYEQKEGENITLMRGSRGEKVLELQLALAKLNYEFKPTSTTQDGLDGIFGKDTEKNVKLFQGNNGLTVDGIWKDAEQAKLDTILKNNTPPLHSDDEDQTIIITLPLECAKTIKKALKGVV